MTRAVHAEIVAALADARPDPATERFDAKDVALAGERRYDQRTRTLLWWLRESRRGLRDHDVNLLTSDLLTQDKNTVDPNITPESVRRADNINELNANIARSCTGTRTVIPPQHQRSEGEEGRR